MAFLDKLKGVADKAKEAAERAAAAAKEKIEQQQQAAQQAEADRKAAEKKQKEDEKLELKNYLLEHFNDYPDDYMDKWRRFLQVSTDEEIEEFEQIRNEKRREATNQSIADYLAKVTEEVNCDIGKGDCCWLDDKFYCTCGNDTVCQRKKYVKEKQYDCLFSNAHLPHIKALATYKKEQDFIDDGKWKYRSADLSVDVLDVFKHFFITFFPEYDLGWLDERMMEYFIENGFGKNNAVLGILIDYQEKTNGKALPWFHTLVEFNDIDLHQDFFKNPSLYDRNFKDFSYTVKILDIVSNPDKLREYYDDNADVSLEQLYNADGTIKEAGIGGPKNGFYGDVIYNIVESWGGEEE